MKKICHLALIVILSSQTVWAQSSHSSIRGSRVACVNKMASDHACRNIDLLARLSRADMEAQGILLNDIWGWTDPDTKREYALVGTAKFVAFVDVTDPVSPIYLGKLPGHDSQFPIIWRDMKVYNNHMYVTVDGGNNGMQVFDLRQLRDVVGTPRDFKETAHYDGILKAHNLAINEETGFAYITAYRLSRSDEGVKDTCNGAGLHIVDIRDPGNPTYAGCFADHNTGYAGSGYSHDAQCVIYRGPDANYQGREICIGSNENHISIADVTDKENPVPVGIATYPNAGYAHQGWLTSDQEYFIMNDELDEANPDIANTRMIIWDLQDLEDPVYHSAFYFSSTGADHNLYVHGDYVFAANYTEGLRIVDISDINQPREIAFFDTHPERSTGLDGAWSSYRFPGSGTTIVGSHPHGLMILDPRSVTVATHIETSVTIPEAFSLSPAYPNPFNPVTSAILSLPEQAEVRADVLDLLGRSVEVLEDGVLSAGEHTLTFDASQLPSGTYYIRVQTDGYLTGTRAILVK